MKESVGSTVFGKRKEPHTVIIARGNDIRHFTVRPWLATLAGSALAAIAVGYLLATTYLVLRDDLIDATTARQARLQQAYEDRIAALREQVDRITSRQLLDQQIMESKVGELLKRQTQLSARHGRLGPILDRAEAAKQKSGNVSSPPGKLDIRAGLTDAGTPPAQRSALASLAAGDERPFSFWSTRSSSDHLPTAADRADELFAAINQSLQSIETEQLTRVNALAEDAYQTADAISDALRDAGLPIDKDHGKDGLGGPLVPVDSPTLFEARVRELDEALDALDQMKNEARRLPIANPAPGHSISSIYGIRKDPLLGSPALHSGMDFRAPSGFAVRCTAAGTVVNAGWSGGYGRMVEVDHGDGFTTRYAHLSDIAVKEGQKVVIGEVVGKVGSSGRSTGPHLHYEVRRNGDAIDPLRFLKAGKKVSRYL